MQTIFTIPEGSGMLTDMVYILGGILLLVIGGVFLVEGGRGIASKLGIKSIVVGLTIMAFSTSAPELAFNVIAAGGGHGELTIGNIFGSNIANLGLVLGIGVLLHNLWTDDKSKEMKICPKFVTKQCKWLIASTVVVLAFTAVILLLRSKESWIIQFNPILGVLLLVAFGLFFWHGLMDKDIPGRQRFKLIEEFVTTYFLTPVRVLPKRLISNSKSERKETDNRGKSVSGSNEEVKTKAVAGKEKKLNSKHMLWYLVCILVGLFLLGFGGKFAEVGAISAAKSAGVSDIFIGVTIVAIATSLPELVTTVIAAWKDEGALALGNIVGSNIFNLLFVLPITMIFANAWASAETISEYGRSIPIDQNTAEILVYGISMLGITTIAAYFIMERTKSRETPKYDLTNIEGAILLLSYICFIVGVSVWTMSQ